MRFFLATWIGLVFTSVALGQTVTGSISGTVTDASGAAAPGVKVSVQNVLTGETHTVVSDGQGDYLFPVLPVGRYRVDARSLVRHPGAGRDPPINRKNNREVGPGLRRDDVKLTGSF